LLAEDRREGGLVTSVSDFDPQYTQATAKRIHALLADKGNVLGSGTVVVLGSPGGPAPEAQDDSSSSMVIHHVSSLTYMDDSGHLHAVLLDQVTTIPPASGDASTTLEILSDVPVS
jgi:hypothetical protein